MTHAIARLLCAEGDVGKKSTLKKSNNIPFANSFFHISNNPTDAMLSSFRLLLA